MNKLHEHVMKKLHEQTSWKCLMNKPCDNHFMNTLHETTSWNNFMNKLHEQTSWTNCTSKFLKTTSWQNSMNRLSNKLCKNKHDIVFTGQSAVLDRKHDFFPDLTYGKSSLNLEQAFNVSLSLERAIQWHSKGTLSQKRWGESNDNYRHIKYNT